MLALILPMVLKWLPGGILQPILQHLQHKADSKNEALRIEVERELGLRQAQRDVLIKESEHWIAWLPRFLIGMSVAIYIAAIFAVSTWQLPFVVLRVPDAMEQVMWIVVGAYFLDKTVSRFKR